MLANTESCRSFWRTTCGHGCHLWAILWASPIAPAPGPDFLPPWLLPAPIQPCQGWWPKRKLLQRWPGAEIIEMQRRSQMLEKSPARRVTRRRRTSMRRRRTSMRRRLSPTISPPLCQRLHRLRKHHRHYVYVWECINGHRKIINPMPNVYLRVGSSVDVTKTQLLPVFCSFSRYGVSVIAGLIAFFDFHKPAVASTSFGIVSLLPQRETSGSCLHGRLKPKMQACGHLLVARQLQRHNIWQDGHGAAHLLLSWLPRATPS